MAPAGVRGWAWPAAGVLAAGFIALVAFHGERPEPGLARFQPAGLLADWPIEQVTSVEVSTGTRHRSLQRAPGIGWHTDSGEAPDLAVRIETGLTLLRNSAPQRTDLTAQHLGEFGLEPPRLTVTVRMSGGNNLTIEFGGANPLGLERYARIVGRAEILLIPAFVADAWEGVAAAR